MKKAIALFVVTVVYFGAHHLDRERLGGAFNQFWKQAVLPFRIARLYAQPPDNVLSMPVQGVRVRRVTDTWKAPRPGGRLHEGQDIFARRGTPIFSATEGIVIRIANQTLGGNSIFVAGPGRRTYYYAHLDRYAAEIEVGDRVDTSTILGYVGNTGNARTTPPHLHFGIYLPSGAINPLPLLADRSPLENAAFEQRISP